MAAVVVGIDGSKRAQPALAWALEEARLRGADLRVVHADQTAAVPPARARAAAKQVIEETLAAADDTGGVPVERVSVADRCPATTLIDASWGADLLVVGSRGLGGFAALLLGSVSQQCVTYAHCPVVVVPDGR